MRPARSSASSRVPSTVVSAADARFIWSPACHVCVCVLSVCVESVCVCVCVVRCVYMGACQCARVRYGSVCMDELALA